MVTLASLVFIFVSIGVAHATSHVLLCSGCKNMIEANVSFAVEILIRTLGWPYYLYDYLKKGFFTSSGPKFEIKAAIHINPLPNESKEDYVKRIQELVSEKIKEVGVYSESEGEDESRKSS